MQEKINWYQIARDKNELNWRNNLIWVEVGGRKITLAKVDEQVFACAAKCPHAGGMLSEGTINIKGEIVCPLHKYTFNVGNGRNVSGEGYKLKTYRIEERNDGLYVAFAEDNLSDLIEAR